MLLRQHPRRNYVALHSGTSEDILNMADDTEEVFHDSFSDPLAVQKAEAESLEAELETLNLAERIKSLRLLVKQKKDNIADVSQDSGYQYSPDQCHDAVSTAPVRPTLKTLASDNELNAALEMLQEAHLKDILTPDAANTTPKDGDTTGKCSNSDKVAYITDYVVKPKASRRDSEKELTKNLWIKFNKMKTEDVTVPQWLSANARILLEMLDTVDKDTIRRYLRYTGKVGDYLQVSDAPSVMLFDEEHRRQVVKEGIDWDRIDGDTRYFYLEKDENTAPASKQSKSSYTRGSKKPGPVDSDGNPICIGYNTQNGCNRGWCSYSHVCSQIGCHASHPKFQHYAPPRFRNQRQDH